MRIEYGAPLYRDRVADGFTESQDMSDQSFRDAREISSRFPNVLFAYGSRTAPTAPLAIDKIEVIGGGRHVTISKALAPEERLRLWFSVGAAIPPLLLHVNAFGAMRLCAQDAALLTEYKELFPPSELHTGFMGCEIEEVPDCEKFTACYLLKQTDQGLRPHAWRSFDRDLFRAVVAAVSRQHALLVVWQRGFERYVYSHSGDVTEAEQKELAFAADGTLVAPPRLKGQRIRTVDGQDASGFRLAELRALRIRARHPTAE